jgi:hypothetical protein
MIDGQFESQDEYDDYKRCKYRLHPQKDEDGNYISYEEAMGFEPDEEDNEE